MGRSPEWDSCLEHPDGLDEFREVTGDEESPWEEDDDTFEAADLDTDEEDLGLQERLKRSTFVVASKALASLPNWVSVSDVFKSDGDGEVLEKAGITSLKDPRYAKYVARLQRLRRIREYPYVMHVLERELSYEEVAEIFLRVNSLGMKLRGSDLALAQITARWRNSLALLEEFQEECEERWFTFDLGLLVRAMVVFASKQSRFRSVANIPISRLKDGWEDAKEGLRFAINFLATNAGIEDESLLSSPLFVITIAYLSHLRQGQMSAEEERELVYWLYVANAKGRYSRGSSETLLDADLSLLSKGGTASDLTEQLRQQFGRLNFEVSDLTGKAARSPIFSLTYLALKAGGAKDWYTGLGLSLTHQGRLHYIQHHHIFPKSLLKGHYDKREVNEIANMAFISGRTNRKLSNKPPIEYFPKIIEQRGEEALASQCVPLHTGLHELSAYPAFLSERRQKLTDALNRFVEAARRPVTLSQSARNDGPERTQNPS